MSALSPSQSAVAAPEAGPELTDAAVAAFRRLQRSVGTVMLAHERPDGSLICERSRPGVPSLFYRVTASGRINTDRRYDCSVHRFVSVPLPLGID